MNGVMQVKSNFSMEYFMIPDQPVTKFMELNAKYFSDGHPVKVYSITNDIDVSSVES